MTQTKLLVVTTDHHMSSTQQAEFLAKTQAIADKVGAELLMLEPGQRADLLDGCIMPDKTPASEIRDGLRRCSQSRKEYWGKQVGTGALASDRLAEGIAKLCTLAELIHKRGEDTSALLYKWDRAGKQATESLGGLKIEVDTSDIDTAVDKIETLQGFATGFVLDPLEQAIESTVRVVAEAEGELAIKLSRHLDTLLAEQVRRVTAHK